MNIKIQNEPVQSETLEFKDILNAATLKGQKINEMFMAFPAYVARYLDEDKSYALAELGLQRKKTPRVEPITPISPAAEYNYRLG